MTSFRIEGKDDENKPKETSVTRNNALKVSLTDQPAPKTGTENVTQYLQGRLGSAGLESGALTQNVDGSATSATFFMTASPDFDIHIQQITAVIADNLALHNRFGNIPQLSVGWDLKLTEAGVETFIMNKAQTGGRAIAQSGFARPFGDGAGAFAITNWTTGNDDAQIINIPVGEFIPGGIRLGRGSVDKLESIINDNLLGLEEMIVYIYGYKRFP